MAVMIRMSRFGKKDRPYFRVVAADKERWRDGRFIELLGTYDGKVNPAKIALNEPRIRHWIGVGAQYSSLVRSLIKKTIPGLIEQREENQLKKIKDARKKRKLRQAKSGGTTAAAKKAPAKKASAKKSAAK